jgi:hypothetical protein
MYKLTFFVPGTHLEKVKKALFDAGAGRYRNYDSCSWQTKGIGQFRPLEDSDPFIGSRGDIEEVEEYKVEMICAEKYIKPVLDALISAHPYEEPAYDVTTIMTADDFG